MSHKLCARTPGNIIRSSNIQNSIINNGVKSRCVQVVRSGLGFANTQVIRSITGSGYKELVARIRGESNCPLGKVVEAVNLNGSYESAMAWIEKELERTGEKLVKKANKELLSRGLICMSESNEGVLSLVVLNCQTDFVARTRVFQELLLAICKISGQIFDNSPTIKVHVPEELGERPIGIFDSEDKRSVESVIKEAAGKTGENIRIKGSYSVNTKPEAKDGNTHFFFGKYIHNIDGIPSDFGKSGVILVLRVETKVNSEDFLDKNSIGLQDIADKLARHVAGCRPTTIFKDSARIAEVCDNEEPSDQNLKGDVLLEQEFLYDESVTVGQKLESLGSEINAKLLITDMLCENLP